jgi:putative ABC transport system ATP-binding protein
MSNAIEVKNLSKTVPDAGDTLRILDDISFAVESADSLAITGASGSGKSTLLGLLAGLDVPSHGDVFLTGQSLFAMDEERRALYRARHVGFVFQSFHLLPHLNVLENVILPLELQGAPHADARARAMIEQVGLSPRVRHTPKTLSGGEQQRVALARAFVAEPAIIFADEPTGSLDFTTGSRIIDLMFELQMKTRATLVLVTHDPALAGRCGRQLSLAEGRLRWQN